MKRKKYAEFYYDEEEVIEESSPEKEQNPIYIESPSE